MRHEPRRGPDVVEASGGYTRPRDVGGRPLAGLICVLLAAFVKLALVAHHEIIAGNHPHDDYWQIVSAAYWHWWRPYDVWTLMHLPVYPWFIAVTGAIGLPLRLSIELLYLAGAGALSAALGRLGLATPLQATALVLIVFHPYSFDTFDYARAGTLYACLLIFFVALFIRLIVPRSPREFRRSALLFACTTALLWHCRKESILIGGLFGIMAVGILAAFIVGALARAEALRLGLVLVAVPLGAAIALGAVISTANGLRYGLWHTDQMTATNYVRAYSSLQAIRPDRPIRFIPVTRDARQKAYAVSPAFRELQPFFEGPREPWYLAESKRWLGLPGEIGAGWYYWALVDAAAAAGHFKTAPAAEAFFGRIADEITAAVKDGRVASRRVLLPYIDPAFSLWLPHLPGSFVKLAGALLPSHPPDLPTRPAEVQDDVVADFDAVAHRRAKAPRASSYLADGWALSSSAPPIRVEVIDGEGKPLRASFQSRPRPDVPVMRDPSARPGPAALGFTVAWVASRALESVRLKVVLEASRSAVSGPLSSIPLSQGTRLHSANTGDVVFIALDRLEKPVPTRGDRVAAHVARWYPVFLSLVAVAGVARLIVVVAAGGAVLTTHAIVVLLFVLAIIVSRLGLFAVLDASAWAGDQTRYVFPIATLAAIVPVIVFALGRLRLAPGLQPVEGRRDAD
jgi:hypothetical protein